MTGAVMPAGADTVVMQERATEDAAGVRVAAGAVTKAGQNRRFAGEDLKARADRCFAAGQLVRPAELGHDRLAGHRRGAGATAGCASRSSRPATSCASIGTPLAAGEVYDSNRYTLYGMLARLGCDVIDMGVVRDDPAALEARVRERGRRRPTR